MKQELNNANYEKGVYFWSDKDSTLKQISLANDKLVFKPYLDTHNKCVILPTYFNPQAPVEWYNFHIPIELMPFLTTKGETL